MLRRDFIKCSAGLLLSGLYLPEDTVMTVRGPVNKQALGTTLMHEHVLVDFIGADLVSPDRYNATEAFDIVLPHLKQVATSGCNTLVECTPAYLGRDVKLLQKLSEHSGLNIITNTGYYGAAKEKFLPPHAYTMSAKQLADLWINEWRNGIGNTDIKPGFIKSSVDVAPLSEVQQKLIEAACLTHLSTGLSFAVHTGNGAAALAQLDIIQRLKVKPEAWIWVHAQNEKDYNIHSRLAKTGAWISFDGLNEDNGNEYLLFLQRMKREGLLHKILISHDAGWYHVGEPKGGNYRGHTTVFSSFIPLLLKNGFSQVDIKQLFISNPANALCISVRRA